MVAQERDIQCVTFSYLVSIFIDDAVPVVVFGVLVLAHVTNSALVPAVNPEHLIPEVALDLSPYELLKKNAKVSKQP